MANSGRNAVGMMIYRFPAVRKRGVSRGQAWECTGRGRRGGKARSALVNRAAGSRFTEAGYLPEGKNACGPERR